MQRKRRIVAADDDPDTRSLLEFKLGSLGHQVELASDGERALERMLADPPDLVVIDWMMPRLTGLEVCAAVRSDRRFDQMPLILLTGRAQDIDLQRGLAAGADDYLVKPFSLRELASRVEAHLLRTERHGSAPDGRRIPA